MKHIFTIIITLFLTQFILPSPVPFTIQIFGEQHPFGFIFLTLLGVILYYLILKIVDTLITFFYQLQKKHQD